MIRYDRFGWTVAAIACAALVSGCGGSSAGWTPSQTSAPSASALMHPSDNSATTAYRAVGLASLGGNFAAGISDNEQGWIAGNSLLSDNATTHATLWLPGTNAPVDLRTLGGTNSAVEWPNHAPNTVVGISQLAQSDPLGEQWSCAYPAGFGFLPYTGQECRGFRWTPRGGMTQLGTLGGDNSFATGANASGKIVGWAETSNADSTCVSPQILGFNAVVWDREGTPRALAQYAQDPDSAATAINDRGDVVGISGICENAVGALSAEHMILWRKYGAPLNIGSLGGSAWNTPMMVNDQDDVVGFSDRPGDDNGNNFNGHAFLWTPASNHVSDLGTLAGDAVSYAYSVNDRGLIVGQSCTPGCASSRAFVYEGETMYDLNGLLDSASGAYDLVFANDINDEGQITGLAVDTNNGSVVGFRLIPDEGPAAHRHRATARHGGLPMYRLRTGPFGRAIPARR